MNRKDKQNIAVILKIVGIIVLLFGLFFGLAFGGTSFICNMLNNSSKEKLEELKQGPYENTAGTITQNSSGTSIEYQVNGRSYTIYLSVSSSSYYVGRNVNVYYQSNNPDNAMVPEIEEDTYKVLSLVFGIIGGVMFGIFFIISMVLFISSSRVKKSASANSGYGNEYNDNNYQNFDNYN